MSAAGYFAAKRDGVPVGEATLRMKNATQGNLVYVLNARSGGSLAGFRVDPWGGLHAIAGSTRSLGLTTPTDPTEFTHTPGQVAFSPNGHQLLVTTKATTSSIDVFGVHPGGWLDAAPVVNAQPGAVPFAVTFDAAGRLVVADAGTNAVSTFWLGHDGVLASIDAKATNQAATCWVSEARGHVFASNAGSGSVSTFGISPTGQLSAPTATAASLGTVDSATTPSGRFLYVQGGRNGTVDAYQIGWSGSLTHVGTVTVPNAAGGEGIVAL